jgi:quinol monooxygenase YgiN
LGHRAAPGQWFGAALICFFAAGVIAVQIKRAYDPIAGRSEHMAKLAIVATIKTVPGKRDEFLKHLKAHGQRCLATEPGTLKFDILVPKEEADTVMLYEVYASPEAFQTHWTGPSMQQVKEDTAALQVSLSGVRCDLAE